MPRPGAPRPHRLPQWTDHILVPAPSDLSISEVASKSPLPAIVVTPSSPSARDFSLAFIPSSSPLPLSLSEENNNNTKGHHYVPFRTYFHYLHIRFIFCAVVLLCFVCHLVFYGLVQVRLGRHQGYSYSKLEDNLEGGQESGHQVHQQPQQYAGVEDSSLFGWFAVWDKWVVNGDGGGGGHDTEQQQRRPHDSDEARESSGSRPVIDSFDHEVGLD